MIVKKIIAPLQAVLKDRCEFVIWLIFVILAGQSGTIINIIGRCNFNKIAIQQSILADSISGSFYTYSLTLVTSAIGSIMIKFIKKTKPEHRKFKILFVSIAFIICLFNAVFYSFATQNNVLDINMVEKSAIELDFWQLVFFILAILVSIYTLGLTKISDYDEFDELDDDDYKMNEDNRVLYTMNTIVSVTDDGDGVKM